METRAKQTEHFKGLMYGLEDKNDRIALLWNLVNANKINRRQFKELINCLRVVYGIVLMCYTRCYY